MRFKKIVKLFEQQNICVVGLRGRGKDMLISNVVARRKIPYVSNVDYTHDENFNEFDYAKLDVKNTYKDFINHTVKPYRYPYPDRTDVYISDAGIYFPSQYCNELNKDYKSLATLMSLSRQLGLFNVHINAQSINRVFDKIREQSDLYIDCQWCKVFFGKYVLQKIIIYDKLQTCIDRIKPPRIRVPLRIGATEAKAIINTHLDAHRNTYGRVEERILFYKLKSKYDTRIFKTILEGGKPLETTL